ncbi:MAG: AEC family transporter [Firmicutes bacterium]|nr:AEC family transporter [Bacillota bacterium]
MLLVFGKVLSIFLIVGVGFVANKIGVLPNSANDFMSDLLIKITGPCMVIASIASKTLEADTIALSLETLGLSVVYFALFTAAGYLLFGKILKFQPKDDVAIYTMILASMNCGFMGFPLTLSLFGNDILYLMVLVNIIHTLYLYPFGSIQLSLTSGGSGQAAQKMDVKAAVRSAINPCTIAAILGIVILFAKLSLPEFLFSSIEMIGDATVPLSMLMVGMQLGNSNLSRIFTNKKLVATSLMKMLLMPVLMFLMVNWLPISVNLKVTLIFACCFPSGVAIVPVISLEKRNALLAAEGVTLTTLLSMIVIPLSSMFLLSWYGLA